MNLHLHTTHPQTRSEGPGERFAIWVQGCSIRCPGCCNPEMLNPLGGHFLTVEDLANQALQSGCEEISLLGGEPFDQEHACGELARLVRKGGMGVMLFTGYEYEKLQHRKSVRLLLDNTDLLKCGPYVERLHSTAIPWVGSSNQRLVHLTERYRAHPDLSGTHRQGVTYSQMQPVS